MRKRNRCHGAKSLQRRLRWFGHVARLHEDTPARRALNHALRPVRLPPGAPKTTWLKIMKSQLKDDHNMDFQEALNKAQDIENYKITVKYTSTIHKR